MAILDQIYDKANWDNISALRFGATVNVQLAQSFTPALPGTVGTIKLFLGKNGSPTGNVWVGVYSDSGGLPNTQIGGNSDNVSVAGFSTSSPPADYTTFTFSGTKPTVVAGTTYWIVLSGDFAFSSSNYVRVFNDTSSPSYSGGMWGFYDGTSWGNNSAVDAPFAEYVNPVLTATQASFALTGEASTFHIGHTVVATQASFSLTGKNALFPIGRAPMTAVKASFTLTGENALFTIGKGISVIQASFTLTGESVILTSARSITATQTSFTLTGENALFPIARSPLSAIQTSFALTGEDALFTKALNIVVAQASFTFTGENILFEKAWLFSLVSANYILTGENANLNWHISNTNFSVDYGSFSYAGYDASFILHQKYIEEALHTNSFLNEALSGNSYSKVALQSNPFTNEPLQANSLSKEALSATSYTKEPLQNT